MIKSALRGQRPGLARELIGSLSCGLLRGERRLAVFVAYADESSGKDSRDMFIYGGFAAPWPDWQDLFAPAWEERILNKPPCIPYLHMTEIRSRKWREQHNLTEAEAEERVDDAIKVIESFPSLYLATSCVDGGIARNIFQNFKISPGKRRKKYPMEPNYYRER